MDHIIELNHIAKQYPGLEKSLRGTKLEVKGPLLWARNLSRAARLTSNTASSVTALDDVSLAIDKGEIFGLLGLNGSGKTTLIKILAGLIRPNHGTGQVAGISLDYPKRIRQRVSYVSTLGWMGLEWPLTAQQNVEFFAILCGMSQRLAKERSEAALRDVALWDVKDKYSSQLSNGMRQRVILARALLFRTPIVLLDEPTVGLDPATAKDILDLIRGTLRKRGQTIVLTDHQTDQMAELADRVAVLHEGKVVIHGTPSDVVRRLEHLIVIEVQTEGMEQPTTTPPSCIQRLHKIEHPGPLRSRNWRIHALDGPGVLAVVLDWLTQPSGLVVFVAQSKPTLQDVLMFHASENPQGGALTSGTLIQNN